MAPSVCGVSLAVVVVLVTLVSPGGACPRPCSCYQPTELHCTFRSLLTIPQLLPQHTLHINLGFNSISRIPDSSLAGLRRLELLMLHGNDIREIPDQAFQDLSSLQVLKLSYNKLREISAESFSGLSSLLRLHLDHNQLQFLHPQALLRLPNLRLIRLQGNRLHQLHPQAFCTLSLLQTFCYSNLRHLDVSNNSLTILPRDTLRTAPLLESLALQANPWSCDCSMAWMQAWSISHPGVLKCPGPQCPVCASPKHMKGRGLLQQKDLSCTSPVISTNPRASSQEDGEVQPIETFREALGNASLGMSDQQGNAVDLKWHGYERLWRLLAYYSEMPVRLQREIMLSKAPRLAYRYRQTSEKEGYYHTGVRARIQAQPAWLLQPHVSLELNRAQSSAHRVKLTLSTLVFAPPDLPSPQSWVLIQTNHTHTAFTAAADRQIHLPCPVLSSIGDLSSEDHRLQWVFPDGSTVSSPYRSSDGRVRVSGQGLVLQRVDHSDAGLYYCVARAGGDVDVLPLRLVVVESSNPPPGEELGPAVTGLVGDPVSLPCESSGTPRVEVNWVLPGGRVVGSRNEARRKDEAGVNVLANGSLSLPNPALGDAGLYRCVAVNQYGADSLSTRLMLTPRPDTSSHMRYLMRPQSAAGVSNRVRAPLGGEEIEEGGSGDDEGENILPTRAGYNRTRRPPIRSHMVRVEGSRPPQKGKKPLRRGFPVEQRRNRLEGRRSFNLAKHKIDPQKWADLLTKIRGTTPTGTEKEPSEIESSEIEPLYPETKEELSEIGPPATEKEPSEIEPPATDEEEPSELEPPATDEEPSEIEPPATDEEEPSEIEPPATDEEPSEIEPPATDEEEPSEIEPPATEKEPSEIEPPATDEEEPTTFVSTNTTTIPTTTTTIPTTTTTIPTTTTTIPTTTIILTNTIVWRNPGVNSIPDSHGSRYRPPSYPTYSQHSSSRHPYVIIRPDPVRTPLQTPPPIKHAPSLPHPIKPKLLLPDILEIPSSAVPTTRAPSSSPKTSTPTTDSQAGLNPESTLPHSPPASPVHSVTAQRPPQTSVLRVRPRIAPPHMRSMSVPAEIDAFLPCEAIGQPPPTITWTKVSTGAVMSLDYKAERFQVLPSGTFLIRSVQVQDRGTYICSAQNSVGLDRAMVTLDVWSRPPRIQLPNHRDATVPQGGEVRLECRAQGVPVPLLSWVLPDRTVLTPDPNPNPALGTHPRVSIFPNGTLRILVAGPADRGLYRCVASNPAGAGSLSVRLHVSSLPPVIQEPREERVTRPAGLPLYAQCSARGAPAPSIRWRTPDGTFLLPSQFLNGNLFVLPNATLLIRKLATKDSGSYECLATNAVGGDKRTVRVEVTGDGGGGEVVSMDKMTFSSINSKFDLPPSSPVLNPPLPPSSPLSKARILSTSPSSSIVIYGESLLLYCSATGNPEPRVVWRVPGKKLVDARYSFDKRMKVHSNGTLYIQSVTEKDGGDYLCVARNKMADDFRLLQVTVATKPAKIEPKQPSNLKVVSYGAALKVDCLATGQPNPAVRWSLPDGTSVKSLLLQVEERGRRSRRLVVFDNGTLFLPSVGMEEEGEYVCHAENQGGRDTMSVMVKVLTSPPSFPSTKYEVVKVQQGGAVALNCGAKGEPVPTITWLSPMNRVLPVEGSGPVVVQQDGSLVIQGARGADGGNYTCRASNAAGERSKVMGVEVMVTPPSFTLNGAGGGINGADRQIAVASGSGLSAVISISQSAGRDHTVSAGNCVSNNGDSKVGDQRVSAVRGQTVLLPCPSQGFPLPRLAWLLPGNGILPVPYYGSRLTVHRNGTLELRGVRASDSGMLVCVNRGERGEARRMVHLEVSDTKDTAHSRGPVTTEKPCPVGPVSTEQPRPVGPVSTEQPRPVVPVSREKLRSGGPDREETPRSRGPVTTEISRQETPRPTGPVINEKPRLGGPVSTENPLPGVPVQGDTPRPRGPVPEAGRSVVLERKPVVTSISGSLVSIINGENLQLPCPQTDSPSQGSSQTESLTWKLPSGVVVSRGQAAGTGRYSVLDDGTLTVQQVSVFDRGTYSCRSTNQDTSSILTVPVIVIAYPPRITNGPPPLTYTRPGVAVQLTCYVIATPRATITWEMPDQSQLRVTGQARLYGNRYLSPQGSLVIQNPTSRDTGFYRCSARNVIGTDTKATYLHVI
ncbi:matrix-remodeling-associated protein 5-like [Salmo trutta]|uniref:matrix-remodeling-associated protein 5-like n=1 Tax=Salmo trutta TaxID=8032 RepID=UPI00112FE130|nr:matrix-remodeling-associated protein 5-like [Salmo trutta]